jgi:chemotaxis protein MotB
LRELRHRRPGARAGHDRWLVSYADFITLLFAFFTTMYAISTVDGAKLTTVATGLQRAFDAPPTVSKPHAPSVMSGTGILPGGRGVIDSAGVDARAFIENRLHDDVSAGRIELSQDGRGVVMSIPEAGSFPIGSADLSASAEQVLSDVAATVAEIDAGVTVEGHTDDAPIHTSRFESNWELSTARATRVVQFLIERGRIDPARLSAAGYGEYHPRAENQTPEGRARNRRVDLVVLTAQKPAADANPGVSR